MKAFEIDITDWHRILFGTAPLLFNLEVIIRSIAVFAILIISMRLMGHRMSGQMNRNEMASLVTLAAGVGVPLLAPDRGLLPAVIVALVVVSIQRIVSYFSIKSERFEELTQDRFDILVKDGVIQPTCLEKTQITKERLFAELRSNGLYHLGQVKRLYLEANGTFTLLREKSKRPGLCVLPRWDDSFARQFPLVPFIKVCNHCGKMKKESSPASLTCPLCQNQEWVPAYE